MGHLGKCPCDVLILVGLYNDTAVETAYIAICNEHLVCSLLHRVNVQTHSQLVPFTWRPISVHFPARRLMAYMQHALPDCSGDFARKPLLRLRHIVVDTSINWERLLSNQQQLQQILLHGS